MQERALAGSRPEYPAVLCRGRDPRPSHGVSPEHRAGLQLGYGLIEATSAFAAAEAAAEGLHQVYAPMIDISRDPRWAAWPKARARIRCWPRIAGQAAGAAFRARPGPGRVAACLKHFVAYGAPQSRRDYDNVSLAGGFAVICRPLPPGVRAASVMVAFNAVNKLPMHANAPR